MADRLGIDVVFRFIPTADEFQSFNATQAYVAVRGRIALKYPEALDVTDDVLEELSPMYRGAVAPPPPESAHDTTEPPARPVPDEQAVLELLDEVEFVQLEQLADRAPFGIARLQTALFGLELKGLVECHPGRHYALRPQ